MTNKYINTVSGNYTFDKVREKVDKGQFLTEVEKNYMAEEARSAAESIRGRYAGRGPRFWTLVATALNDLARRELPETKPTTAADLFGGE
jgi:hypothetical protein